jgi:hypothetical protein
VRFPWEKPQQKGKHSKQDILSEIKKIEAKRNFKTKKQI